MRIVVGALLCCWIMTAAWGNELGTASVYSGERTSNGHYARYGSLTAAHRTLPFGTLVKVTNVRNSESVIVEITDRGPAAWTGRLIDLTPMAAELIGVDGLGAVRLEVVGRDRDK